MVPISIYYKFQQASKQSGQHSYGMTGMTDMQGVTQMQQWTGSGADDGTALHV